MVGFVPITSNLSFSCNQTPTSPLILVTHFCGTDLNQSMDQLSAIFVVSEHREIDLDAVMSAVGQELLHYARVLCGSLETAEDSVQDTLLSLLKEGPRAAHINSPRAWLFTVLRRKALNYRRSETLRDTELARELSQSVESDASERLILEEGMRRLSALDQEIILLHLWEGLTFEAIGLVLEAPRNTVLSRYARAIERLRGFFDAPQIVRKRQEVRC